MADVRMTLALRLRHKPNIGSLSWYFLFYQHPIRLCTKYFGLPDLKNKVKRSFNKDLEKHEFENFPDKNNL